MRGASRTPRPILLAFLALVVAASTIAQESKAPPLTLAGAMALRVAVADLPADASDPLDPASTAWEKAPATRLVLSRTPRLFQTEPTRQPSPPAADVRVLQRGTNLVVRLSWDDRTEDAPRAPEARRGEAGVPKLLYKQPTNETATFSDAAAVMIPEGWKGPAFPSLVMGDEKTPAILYHWSAARGTGVLRARGRANTTRLDRSFPARAVHRDGKWTATLEIPAPAIDAGYPVAFAIWDGGHGDRDGLKFFSVWYVLSPPPSPVAPPQGATSP